MDVPAGVTQEEGNTGFSINLLSARGGGGGGGGRCQTFYFLFFPCSADHERDWPPCKVVFFGLATNALNVRNNNNNNFCGACLNFSREKDSAIPIPRRP